MFFQSNNIDIGLDIGSDLIKIIALKKDGSKFIKILKDSDGLRNGYLYNPEKTREGLFSKPPQGH